jgi:hypothetical protein
MADNTKRKYTIPLEGSLGLLALGYEGLVAWRKVRHDAGQLKEMNVNKHRKEKGKGAE